MRLIGSLESIKRGKKTKFIAGFITVLIIAMLIFSGPASAITINLQLVSGSAETGIYNYKAVVDIHTNDVVPLNLVYIKLTNMNSSGLSHCYYDFVTKAYNSTYSNEDTVGICSQVTITNITNNAAYTTSYSYNYGYGYGNGTGYSEALNNVSWDYGYDYGYANGYGYNSFTETLSSTGEVTVYFTVNSSSSQFGIGNTYALKAGIAGLDNGDVKYTYYNKNTVTFVGKGLDSTAPTITITDPSNNTVLGITDLPYNMTGNVSDDMIGVANVSVYQNGVFLDMVDASNPGVFWSHVWNPASGVYNISIVACDYANNCANTSVYNVIIDTTAPQIISNVTTDADMFYSVYDKYVNISVNASDATALTVKANFSSLSGGVTCANGDKTVNLTLAADGLYKGSCDISAGVNTTEPSPRQIYITVLDGANNLNHTNVEILIHNLGAPTMNEPCMRYGSQTVNFTEVMDFGDIDFIMDVERNISCMAALHGMVIDLPDYQDGNFINISGINMSTREQAEKLGGLGSAIQSRITTPHQFGASRIYVNSTYFAELNTTATVKFYNLPFASTPNIVNDVGAAGVSGTATWVSNGFNTAMGVATGNLTFIVLGFSGYNITDNIAPIVDIIGPVQDSVKNSSSVAINLTINGTKTEISSVNITLDDVEIANYTTANCSATTVGGEFYRCLFNYNVTEDGSKNLTVKAVDYGGASGNVKRSSVIFSVNTNASINVQVINVSQPTYTVNITGTSGSSQIDLVVQNASMTAITIPAGLADNKTVALDFSSLATNTSTQKNVTINANLSLTRQSNETDGINYTAEITAGTVISGPADWDGKLIMPTLLENSSYTAPSGDVNAVIELGSSVELNFSSPVKILIGGMAGKNAAWSRGTTLAEITTECNSGNSTNTTNPSNINTTSPRECSIDDSSDLLIWTYHFTLFGAYTPASTTTDTSTSSSGNGGGSFISSAQLSEGTTQKLYLGGVLAFDLLGERHTVTIKSIKEDFVTIRVLSTPQYANLTVGEEKKFDLNADNVYDLIVKLASIDGINKATIIIKSISEPISASTETTIPGEEETTETTSGIGETITKVAKSPITMIIAAIIIILAIILYVVYKRNNQQKVVVHKHK